MQTEITTCPNRRGAAEVHSSYAPPLARHTPRASSSGFSLVELLVVMAIILVVAAFAVPSMKSTMDAYRVRTTLNSVSGLTQRCRLQSLRKNTSEHMYVQTNGGKVQLFCQDVPTSTGVLKTTDPQITLAEQFSIPGTPTGGPTQMTAATMWGATGAQFAVDSDPFFNSRGLPCGAVGVGTACSTIKGYVYYFKYTAGTSRWAAISISPAGRMQSWFWTGTNWGN